LEEERQRWRGDSGIEGWRDRFREMLNWREDLVEYQQQVESAFSTNTSLKEEAIGSRAEICSEIIETIEKVVADVLNELDKPSKLTDPLPDPDLSEYEEALSEAQNRANKIADQASSIDSILEALEDMKGRVSKFVEELGELS
jgi:uncharacterized phage infection (PIP) family protein YhgE